MQLSKWTEELSVSIDSKENTSRLPLPLYLLLSFFSSSLPFLAPFFLLPSLLLSFFTSLLPHQFEG